MARPGHRRWEGGTGKLGVVLPSFLSLKPKSFPRGGGTRGGSVSCVALSAAAGPVAHVCSGCRDPVRRCWLATAAPTGAPGLASPASSCPRPSGAVPAAAAAGSRVWPALCTESESGGSPSGWMAARRPPCSHCAPARPRATPGCAGLRGGPFPPGRLRARGPAPRRHALPDRAPGGRPLAVGAGPSSSPPCRELAAVEVSRSPGPRASDVPARLSTRTPNPRRRGQLRRSRTHCGHRPGLRLLPFLSTAKFASERGRN